MRYATALILLLLSATAQAADPSAPLRVGIAPVYAPFAFKEGGHLKGIEVDFANRLGKALKRSVTLVELKWDDLIPALREKRVDVVMSGMSATEDRGKLVTFTQPYLQVGQMALIRKTDYYRLRDKISASGTEGLRVGVHRNTTGEAFVRKTYPKAVVVPFDSVDDGIAALRKGEIDAFIHDAPTIWRIRGQLASKYEDLMGRYRPLTEEYLAWAVRQDDTALLDQLNKTLSEWEDTGYLESELDRWIPVRKITLEPNPTPGH